jgi:hypothetical protein
MTRRHYLVIAGAIASFQPVHAQPAASEADALFRQGRELMAAHNYAEACTAFERSQKLEAAVTTLINLAGCREQSGQLATAWGLFVDAAHQTQSSADPRTQQLHQVAAEHARKLEARVSKLTIKVATAARVAGLAIERGGQRVDPAQWDHAMPVDGGTYVVSARAPRATPWSMEITIAPEGDAKTVEVPPLHEVAPAPKPSTDESTSSGDEEEEAPRPAIGKLPIVLGAGAIALGGGALAFSLWGDSTYNAAKAEMADPNRRSSLYNSANTKRYVAQGLGVAGLACAGAAVWMYLHRRADHPRASAHESALIVSPRGIGFAARF